MENDEVRVDARGVPIEVGATCIYGAPVGRSIALVEGEVAGFTESGRVNVRIIRRSYGGAYFGSRDITHVGADRLMIVTGLPVSPLETHAEKMAKSQAIYDEHRVNEATHESWETFEDPAYRWPRQRCTKCGIDYGRAYSAACTA